MSSGLTSRSPERVSDKEEGESHPHMGTKDRKGAGKNSGESGTRNLEAESIRRRVESIGGCGKLKTVIEIRQNSVYV